MKTHAFALGIDRLLAEPALRRPLCEKRLALLAHPASVTSNLTQSLDALISLPELHVTAAFGPQHGIKGDKQDNMVETPDEVDEGRGIPLFSLYGQVRRPTPQMMSTFDVLVCDLQDIGTRVYTFVTTLLYMLEACAAYGKGVVVLDRPNPVGRKVEGSVLVPGAESFVGAGPLPMRHGMTQGELARFFQHHFRLSLDLDVIPMTGYDPDAAPGYGWPVGQLVWVNPSPNAACLNMARCYPGTVLLEGTTLSEGRGTTHPLEVVGAPDLEIEALLSLMERLDPGSWIAGCRLRPCCFLPTFQKHQGSLCKGVQIHAEEPHYQHERFVPYRLMALLLKSLRQLRKDYPIFRDFPYEYVTDRLAIDVINGGPSLRTFVDENTMSPADLEAFLAPQEAAFVEASRPYLLY